MPSNKKDDGNFFFIMGSGRNGSTLLSCILNNHPNICIPPEHSLIPVSVLYWHLHPFTSWNNKVDHVCSLLERPSQWEIDIAGIKQELINAPPGKRNVNHVLRSVYLSAARSQKKKGPVSGDKTPANTAYLKLIKKQFPQSKIVFLVRDPRDVMASYLKANEKYYSDRFDFMLWRWKNSIEKYRSLSKKFPADVMLLKYEALVSDPQKEVNNIIQFLELKSQHGLLDDYGKNLSFMGVEDAVHHQNILNSISTDSIGAWKLSLPGEKAERITKKLGNYMEQFGYEV